MIEPNHIEAIHDSISASLPLLRQLAENSSPEPYTIENIGLTKFNIVISILALFCSLVGAYYGWRGYVMSKMTAVNVERIKPYTQQRLIIEYFRYVLTSYLRTVVIKEKTSKGERPTAQYVNSLSLPSFGDFYYIDRFEQFNGCRIFKINDQPVSKGFLISRRQRKIIEEKSSRKATLEIKRISMDIKRYEDLMKLLLKNIIENHDIESIFCDSMIKKANDIALRNLVVLSYIDGNKMCQCNYGIGREAILNYLIEIDSELECMNIGDEAIHFWNPTVDNVFNDPDSFFYKLLNNEYFNVDEYLSHSGKWKDKGVNSKKELRNYLASMIEKLLVTQSKFY